MTLEELTQKEIKLNHEISKVRKLRRKLIKDNQMREALSENMVPFIPRLQSHSGFISSLESMKWIRKPMSLSELDNIKPYSTKKSSEINYLVNIPFLDFSHKPKYNPFLENNFFEKFEELLDTEAFSKTAGSFIIFQNDKVFLMRTEGGSYIRYATIISKRFYFNLIKKRDELCNS